jgi:hypothetical protein
VFSINETTTVCRSIRAKTKSHVRINFFGNRRVYLNHQEVYESLDEESAIEGLEELPVQVILNRIASVFSKWEKVDK